LKFDQCELRPDAGHLSRERGRAAALDGRFATGLFLLGVSEGARGDAAGRHWEVRARDDEEALAPAYEARAPARTTAVRAARARDPDRVL
jgi:hypothetical protein